MSRSECFEVQIADGIAHLRMCRPQKRNSMIPAFWNELPQIVDEIDSQAKARVIVISSTGPHFTSGMDLAVFATAAPEDLPRAARAMRLYQDIRMLQRSFTALEQCRIPVIAAIQGGCIGGGVDMVTACDLRYATEDAFFCVQETNIAMTADVGTFPRLVRVVPEGIAREMAYLGRRLPAQRAYEVGLVNGVYPDQETMLAEVMNVAREIAGKAPLAVAGCKKMITWARDHSTEDTLDFVAAWNAGMLQPSEMAEAFAAAQEKRPPSFTDLPPARKGM